MLYNTDQILWENYRNHQLESLPNGGARLILADGHISNGFEILARFKDNDHARTVILAAGYTEIETNIFKG